MEQSNSYAAYLHILTCPYLEQEQLGVLAVGEGLGRQIGWDGGRAWGKAVESYPYHLLLPA